MSKTRVFLFLISAVFISSAFAAEDEQLWLILRKNIEKNNFNFGFQGQWRFSNESDKLYEEQLNLSVGQSLDSFDYDFIFTLGTIDSYERVREYRYALQAEKNFNLLMKGLTYNLRFRQELRDFVIVDDVAHRFRIRNQLSLNTPNNYFNELSLSHEFNFYLNSFSDVDAGFSSHRTILSLFKNYKNKSIGFSYVYDVQVLESPDFTRHSLQVSYFF